MLRTETIQGRPIGPVEMAEIQGLIGANPGWSRRRLSEVLAQRWQWYAASGQLKDMAARTLLLKLHERGLIALPPRRCQPSKRRKDRDPDPDLFARLPPDPVSGSLSSLRPLQIQLVRPKLPGYRSFQEHLARHHYLGYRGPVGENLGYLVRSCRGEDLACLLFGAAAWQCAPRDRWIGWSREQRLARLQCVANNSRFLILPWVRVDSLASHVLSQVARRICADWQQHYGHPLHLLETFVEPGRFRGTCYRAANWVHVGQTTGRTRQSARQGRDNQVHAPVKHVYLYGIGSKGVGRLCA